MVPSNILTISGVTPIKPLNAGLFISTGSGIHPSRVINSYELIFVRKGQLSIEEEGKAFEVCAGETLLLFPGRRHKGMSPYKKDLSFYWIHFQIVKGKQRKILMRIPQKHAHLDRSEYMAELFHRFLDDQESKFVKPISRSLIILLMLAEIENSSDPEANVPDTSTVLAHRAELYIKTHFHLPLSTSLVAKSMQSNPDYLGRVFTRVYSISITHMIHKVRLRHARSLLRESQFNIEQIAQQSGFTDAGYFRRIFYRNEGMMPLKYRRLHMRSHINTR
jgi:AraC-like DNA-binding protein